MSATPFFQSPGIGRGLSGFGRGSGGGLGFGPRSTENPCPAWRQNQSASDGQPASMKTVEPLSRPYLQPSTGRLMLWDADVRDPVGRLTSEGEWSAAAPHAQSNLFRTNPILSFCWSLSGLVTLCNEEHREQGTGLSNEARDAVDSKSNN